MSNITPLKLAIYYSYPSLVNNSNGDVSAAAAVFSAYDILVLGSGLETPEHPDHNNTIAIINDPIMANCMVFGYIDATLSLDQIQSKTDLWYDMGNIKGIFLDQFGYDFGVNREKQRSIIWSIHNRASGFKAFVNAWNPDDVFSPAVDPINNPLGLVTRMSKKDWYLAESFGVMNGAYDDTDSDNNGIKDFQDKAFKLINYRDTYKFSIAGGATLGSATFDQNLVDYSYFLTVLNRFNAFSFSEEFYSASSASLPFRTRKPFEGTKFSSQISTDAGILERRTNVGIHVDTNAHTVNILLD
jgi:hypothetical protein